MSLRLDSRPVGDVMVVQCNGRIVAGTDVHSLQLHLRKVLPQYHDVVLQLERVDFVDSSGLGALVRLLSTARTSGGSLRLCSLQPNVRRVLEATHLITLFETYDSEADAIVAAYLGSRYAANGGAKKFHILCVYDSDDVRALLGEVLNRAGYRAVTTGNTHDALILLKATKAKLVVLGASLETVHGVSTKQAMEEIDPAVSLIVLDADFAAQDPGLAATRMLEAIRSFIPPDSSTAPPVQGPA